MPICAPTARKAASKPSLHCRLDVGHLGVELELHPEVEDPLDLGVEDVAGQPIAGDPEPHHPAEHRAGLTDRHFVTVPPQEVRRSEAGRPGADDQHPLPGRLRRLRQPPAVLDAGVAEEPLDGVDPDRLVELPAVAGGLARVVSRPSP